MGVALPSAQRFIGSAVTTFLLSAPHTPSVVSAIAVLHKAKNAKVIPIVLLFMHASIFLILEKDIHKSMVEN